MKFRGFLKKGLKKQFDNVAISDPGSDDSWDLLYTNQEDGPKDLPIEPQPDITAPPSAAASCTAPVAQEQISIKETPTKDDSSVPLTTAANTIAEHKENVVSAQRRKKIVPFTSTPFVRNKQTPTFDVSSIISPIEVSSIEGLPEMVLPNDSGATLVVTRKNLRRAYDNPFNQLLAPDNQSAKPTIGIEPLKTVMNQADTTRQYAGGAMKRRGTATVMQSDEETTFTSQQTKTSSSSSKIDREKQVHQSSAKIEESKGTSVTKANLAIENRIGLQIKNRKQYAAAEVKLSSKSTSRSPEILCPDQSSSPQKMEKMGASGAISNCMPQKAVDEESPKIGKVSGVAGKSSEHNGRKAAIKYGIEEMRDNVDNEHSSKGHLAREEKNAAQGSGPTSIIKTPESAKKANKSVRFVDDAPIEPSAKCSSVAHNVRCSNVLGDAEKINPDQEHNEQLILSKSEIVEKLFVKKSKYKCQIHQDNTMNDKKVDGKKACEEQTLVEGSCESQNGVKNASNQQKQFQTAGDDLEIGNNELTECLPRLQVHTNAKETENAVGLVCHQSEFLVKIGSNTLKQTSCFGFALSCEQKKFHQSDNVGTKPKTCLAAQTQTIVSESNSVRSSHENPERTNSMKGCALKETNPNVLSNNTASILPGCSNEVDSSEEERILLRAQSLKIKENHSHARNSKITKILDNGHFRMNTQSSNRSDQRAAMTKSPLKSCVDGNLLGVNEQSKEREPATLSFTEIDEANCKSLQPQTPNKSGLIDMSESSCDLGLMSRNPTDCPKSCDEDDLLLEIISSEEEDYISRKVSSQSKNIKKTVIPIVNQTNRTKQIHSKHPRRGRSLSLKAKRIRRRREETLRSQRDSSDGESQSLCPSGRRGSSHEIKSSEAGVDNVKKLEQQNKKVNPIAKHASDPKLTNSNNRKSLRSSNPELLEAAESPVFSDKNSDIDERKNREKSKKEKPATSKRALDPQNSSQKTCKIRKEFQKQRDYDAKVDVVQSDEDNIPKLVFPEELTSTEPEPNLPQVVEQCLQKQNEETVPLKRNRDHLKKAKLLLCKRNATVVSQETDTRRSADFGPNPVSSISPNIEVGSRCSRRNRRPPPMYWLSQRVQTNDLEVVKESSDSEPAHHNQNNQNARHKRKLEKTSQSGTGKTLKRVKQTKPKPKASQNDNPQCWSDEEVLIYDIEKKTVLEGEDLTCKNLEVKETEFVSGCGMKGIMLCLGVGAKYDEQKSNTFNQVFYVLDGKIKYKFALEEMTLKPGSVFIIPKGEEYYISNSGQTTGKLFVTRCLV